MTDTENKVIKWHKEQFPWATIKDIESKFREENLEFFLATIEHGVFSEQAIEEFADKCIVFMSGLAKLNLPPLSEHIARKLAINMERKWNPDGTRDKGLLEGITDNQQWKTRENMIRDEYCHNCYKLFELAGYCEKYKVDLVQDGKNLLRCYECLVAAPVQVKPDEK